MSESAVTVFPEPLSPTSATVSPRSMSNDTPRTAGSSPPSRAKETDRSRTDSSAVT
jgi:hypothetical protein